MTVDGVDWLTGSREGKNLNLKKIILNIFKNIYKKARENLLNPKILLIKSLVF